MKRVTDITSLSGQTATLLAARGIKAQLEALTGQAPTLLEADGQVQLVLEKIDNDSVVIEYGEQIILKAASEKNLFHAGMYLINLLATDNLKSGTTTIALPQPRNLLMIDIGRKYFSMAALKKLITQLALFQFDGLQIHFSENEGFGIESERYPEIVSPQHLSKAEIRELIQYAAARFIEIIPDFDSPGHVAFILAEHPEWQLDMLDASGQLVKAPRALDILNPEAVAYVHSIYDEFAELFSTSRYFHIGADEFVPFDELEKYPTLKRYASEKFGADASGIEVFIEYVNHTIAHIRELGFYPLVWNDGFYRVNRNEKLHLSKDCIISYWTRWDKNMAPVSTYLEQGYQVINHNDNYFYYVYGKPEPYSDPTYEAIKEQWEKPLFASQQKVTQTDMEQVFATAIAIWSNNGETKTETEVNEKLFYMLAATMQKTAAIDLGEKARFFDLHQQLFAMK